MEEKRFILELNEKQLRIVNEALEEYFRIRMGQWWDLSDSLASKNLDFSPENPNHEQILNSFIIYRDCVREALEAVGRMLWGNMNNPKSEEQLIAEDIWRVIRYRLYLESGSTDTWRVDAYPPIFVSGEPAPICEVVEKEKEG